MKVSLKELGSRIQRARLKKNLSQEKLAEVIGSTDTHISHIENSAGYPSVPLLVKIMNALELSPNELFCGVVESTRPLLLKETADILEQFSMERVSLLNKQLQLELEVNERKENEKDQGE